MTLYSNLKDTILSTMKKMETDHNEYDIPGAVSTPILYDGDITFNCGDIGLNWNDPEVQKSIQLTPPD